MKFLALGSRIRSLRKNAGLTIEEVFRKTGIPKAQLERFELDDEQPIIAHLIQLSKALSVNVADIFRDRPTKRPFEIVRKEKREKIRPLLQAKSKAKVFDYTYELLTHPSIDKHLEAYMIELPPFEGRRPKEDVTHEGEEFIYLLEGEIRGEIGGEKFELKAGDSLFLRSTQAHIFYNPTDKIARAIAVIYPF